MIRNNGIRLAAALSLSALLACGGGDGGGDGGLTPARNLVGTWTTKLPVKMSVETDFCTDTVSPVGTENWTATWVITPGATESQLNVEMGYVRSGWTLLNGCPGAGYVVEPSPIFLTATVSSTALTLRRGTRIVGEFTFTTDILAGSFDHEECIVYCQHLHSPPKQFILIRK